ncbi:MAG TPA: cupin domain-containing protein, partial [Nannocystaceae bacterium]|nr:cupin domain-containing protein [Nannocystaceae bacterium]
LFDWDVLDRVLRSEPRPDVLVVARGRTLDVPAPRDVDGTRALFREGLGLVVRRAERNDAGLAALAREFAVDLPGKVTIQLFVTPARTQGFGWHYDFEDVFIAQTAGAKSYYFRPNTVDRDAPVGSQPDFTRYTGETSPIHNARLLAADWLYIPARWWHVALCEDDALSISVGVLPQRSRVEQG